MGSPSTKLLPPTSMVAVGFAKRLSVTSLVLYEIVNVDAQLKSRPLMTSPRSPSSYPCPFMLAALYCRLLQPQVLLMGKYQRISSVFLLYASALTVRRLLNSPKSRPKFHDLVSSQLIVLLAGLSTVPMGS